MNKKKQTPALERLQELFRYDAETGSLIRLTRPCNAVQVGDKAGYKKSDGFSSYWIVKVDGKSYPVHAIAWKMAYGKDPADGFDIHHGEGGSLDNRLQNLEAITHRANTSKEKTQKSGLPAGVVFHKKAKRYQAQASLNGKYKYLGLYDTPEQAHQAYLDAIS